MRRLFCLLFTLLITNSFSQILEPVKWEARTEPVINSELEYDIIFTAIIDDKWAIYSQNVGEGGPLPTIVSFSSSNDYKLVGLTTERDLNKETKFDSVFQMTVSKFYNKAIFSQRIKIQNSKKMFEVQGNIEFMTCDDSRCIYEPENSFSFNYLPTKGLSVNDESSIINSTEIDADKYMLQLYGMTSDYKIFDNKADISDSYWSIFSLGFLGGLLALLTPCVFPMVPLTVSFFTKQTKESSSKSGFLKAILYGFFIVLVYLILSSPFHLIESISPDILNEISTNVWLNVFFFLIFIIFAFSFFGYYELTLPVSWTSFSTKGEGFGGILGVFFMALTLSIVSFSCTGPILGSLLAGSLSSTGGAWQLTSGMAGFGLALGLPFTLFAMFPNFLKSLPSSGGWLNTIKVVLGFLELALAFKFLSNADLVEHWGLLKIEVFLGIWILIFTGLVLYIFGVIKFPHDNPISSFSPLRICSGLLVFSFVIYLGYGFKFNSETKTYNPLTLLSGLAPPVGHSIFFPNDTPNNFKSFKDFKKGVDYANQLNKPIIVDFTGYACVNCRLMEEQVWSNESIKPYFQNEYVLISLYVDDKQELPEAEKLTLQRADGGLRSLRNYGQKWAYFQTEFFKSNSQPYYVLLSPDGHTILVPPVGYTKSISDFELFLKAGLKAFKSM